MEYKFNIKNIYCYPQYQNLDNVVFTVIWDYTGTDGIYTFVVPGSTNIPFDNNSSYTPFEELTESQVLSWVDQFTNSSVITEAQATIAYNIEEASKPPEVINPTLPWLNS